MKSFLPVCLFSLLLFSCRSTPRPTGILQTPATFQADEYVINTAADTTLLTKNGALISIPRGSLKSSNPLVTLEIKEAYSMEQMIRAGLTTKAGEELLASGGMIYVNARAGQNVSINGTIKIAIPTASINDKMNLYKGETAPDGSINWNNPIPLPENPQLKMIAAGKALYQRSCASCHAIGKDLTGPNLAHFLKRFSGDTLLVRGYSLHLPYLSGESGSGMDRFSPYEEALGNKLTHLDPALWENQWLYFCNLKARYGSLGTAFPNLSEADLTGIYRYIQNESEKQSLPIPVNTISDNCIDSCFQYLSGKRDLENRKSITQLKKDSLSNEKSNLSNVNNQPATGRDTSPVRPSVPIPPTTNPSPRFEDIVVPENKSSLYYQFSIESFGWFNVDLLIKEVDGSVKSELSVRIRGEYRENTEVFLFIPSVKTYTKGGPKVNGTDELVFAYKDGSIYLPQQTQAYLLAIAETKNSLAYVIKPFLTGLKQEFEISPETADPETFNEAIRRLNMNGLSIHVKETATGKLLKSTDKELQDLDSALQKLEKLRPRNCDCDCIWFHWGADTVSRQMPVNEYLSK